MGWLKQRWVCHVWFEDLVDPKRVELPLRQICDYIHWRKYGHVDHGGYGDTIKHMEESIYPEGSPTFRKGVAGEWRNEFTPEIKRKFKALMGGWILELGYERTTNW